MSSHAHNEQTDGLIQQMESFVAPYYAGKDLMHDLSHIRRLLTLAQNLAKSYDVDHEILALAAFLHGVIYKTEVPVREFLLGNMPTERAELVMLAATGSLKQSEPETLEGKILHDAHLLEGGKTFIITKSLVTGTARGQTLLETVDYIEKKILGQFRCYLPEAQELYVEKERFAEEFLEDLRGSLM